MDLPGAGFQIGSPKVMGSISVLGGSVTGSAGAGLCIVNKPADGPTVSFYGITLVDVAKFDTGQNVVMDLQRRPFIHSFTASPCVSTALKHGRFMPGDACLANSFDR